MARHRQAETMMASRAMAPHNPDGTRFELSLGRSLALCAAGLGILILTALLRRTPEDIGWYLAHVLPGVAVVLFCATRIGRLIATFALLSYTALLPILALLSGFSIFDPWNDGFRVQLFTDNPNLLGADLVAVTLATMVVRPKLPWAVWLPLVALAVVFTGSRTAVLALGVGWVGWLVFASRTCRASLATTAALIVTITAIAFALVIAQQEASRVNLLRASTTFTDSAWGTAYATTIEVHKGVAAGPAEGSVADRVSAMSGSFRLAVFQTAERSLRDVPYVASVYLRSTADEQQIVLSTQLSSAVCRVGPEWTRCVTPPGIGDGHAAAQLRLETRHPFQEFDVYAFGPQLEHGLEPTDYVEKGNTVIAARLGERFDWRLPERLLASSRQAVLTDRLRAFMSSPWIGRGRAQQAIPLPHTQGESTGAGGHAHNLVVETLAADGLLGLLGWSVIAGTMVLGATRRYRQFSVHWLLGVAALNSLDYTILHSGTYFSAAIVCGLAWSSTDLSNPGPPTVSDHQIAPGRDAGPHSSA